ncbi:MAG: heat-inducible transcriptional repressor HrcA [Deltaproteobacteria bacterium]|nr:heat-inducible transcriptional repressor HrcA [Deltaproteobacteria bacterium]
MVQELSPRAKKVLAAVVGNYITTAEPVGSRTISKYGDLGLSPASIRNVMADLEDLGFLDQPHVSAGRVPTPLGLRFYVDTILKVGELDRAVQSQIRLALAEDQVQDIPDLLRTAGKALSRISRLAAVVAAPNPEQELFRHMEFIRLGRGVILVVLVSKSGVVQNRIIEVEEDLGQEELDKYTRYLNQLLANLNLSEVKRRVALEKQRERIRFDDLLSRALTLGHRALDGEVAGEMYIEGAANLINAPEFADVARLRGVFQAFEEKSTLLRLLEQTTTAGGLKIFIGSEEGEEGLDGLTAVTASYGRNDAPVGALGVIGPTRMDYSKVIATVDFTARVISHILDKRDA